MATVFLCCALAFAADPSMPTNSSSPTPLDAYPALAKALGLSGVYFKRDDLHPYGSHKGRSIPVMMEYYFEKGDRQFAVSSSGNAALAAALHAKHINHGRDLHAAVEGSVELDIFVGNHIAAHKLARLNELTDGHIRLFRKERPLQALTAAVEDGARSLRQSTDDIALIGYKSLAEELVADPALADAQAIFVGTSSGTTAQALAQFFASSKRPLQVHIVQTSSCHPMADAFESFNGPTEVSLADAIVDRVAERKAALVPLIEKTGGRGWFATNDDIGTAMNLSSTHALLELSPNSALSVVGAMHAAYRGDVTGKVICLISGE